jgi:hypothetical protein
VTVKNNTFLHPGGDVGAPPEFDWWRPALGSFIFVTEARGVRFEGNVVSGFPSFYTRLVQVMRDAQVKGAERGFSIR